MTRQEKIKEVLEMQKEIKEIKDFEEAIQYNYTMYKQSRFSKAVMRVTVVKTFAAIWDKRKMTEFEIPDKLGLEIAAKCVSWRETLEKRCEALIASDKVEEVEREEL